MNNVCRGVVALAVVVSGMINVRASDPVSIPDADITRGSQWDGKRVGVLGDSMSDPNISATSLRFYNYLEGLLGIESEAYAVSGYKWNDLLPLAKRMHEEHGDSLDAIFIWCGTNDYNASKPIGEFFVEDEREVNADGKMVVRKHREPVMSDTTFCGSINMLLSYLKKNFPRQQIVIFTPIHRGYARFSEGNVQPDESNANGAGEYIEAYVDALRRAGELWSVPVIDFFGKSGLYPSEESNDMYIAKKDTDRLHPNDNGHYRLALTAQYQLLRLPVGFKW